MNTLQQVSQLHGSSPFQVIKSCFRMANKYFFPLVIHTTFSLWIVIFAVIPLWQYYINTFGLKHIIPMIFEIFIYLILPSLELFISAIWLYNTTKKPEKPLKLYPFTLEVAWPCLWEGIKVAVISGLATLLFIIPGFIKTIHYTMVPYVVFFNKNYKAGKVSALKYSKNLSKNFRWWIFFAFMIAPGILSLPISGTLERVHGIANDWLRYPLIFFELYMFGLLSLYFVIALYFLYYFKDEHHMTGTAV